MKIKIKEKLNFKKLKEITDQHKLIEFGLKSSPKTLNLLIERPFLRRAFSKILHKQTAKELLKDKRYPEKVQLDKIYMSRAIFESLNKLLDNAKKNPIYRKAIIERVLPALLEQMKKWPKVTEKYKKEHGFGPPGFLTISPTRFCNLKCTGCYANSSSAFAEKLDWEIIDSIMKEKTEKWGSWFTVISGGEPFLYKSRGKTILDLFEKYPNNFFLVYTNGTLITGNVAKKLAELGNVTPAISVEGFKKETDYRRGKGVHQRILQAFKNLNKYGVPFGISVTATIKNADIVTSDKMMDYYFGKGALYAWIFQLMPIGRGSMELLITPEQRLKMYRDEQHLIKDKKYFLADFWNCGMVSNGCLAGGKGYLYVEWNGNVTPCVFNPYAVANVNKIYKKKNGSLDEALESKFFCTIRDWQKDYALDKKPDEFGNWILPCPIRDHYADYRKFLEKCNPEPIDEEAAIAFTDKKYKKELTLYDKKLERIFNPIWEKEYLEPEKKKLKK